jgi:ASC-1-like (ASCH) protein
MKTLNLIFREVDRATFERIKRGEKTIETRAGLPEYNSIKAGDQLNISCGNDTITKTVTEAIHFKSVEELLKEISPEEIMPKGTTREQAIERWNSFPGYPERIKKDGIIAWRLK